MTTKLTLSAEKDVVEAAKRLAAENNTSVSAMFSRIIRGMAARKHEDVPLTPAVRSISGIVKLPKGKSYDDLLTEALMEKHGIRQ
jgi:predicted nucleic acid-binding protein